MLRISGIFCVLVLLIGCSNSISPVANQKSEWLPQSFAQADSLYQALGVTMSACTTSENFGELSIAVLQKTASGKIADVAIYCGGKNIICDSVGIADQFGIDVFVNKDFSEQNIVVIQGDKNYSGTPELRRLIVNGDTVSGIFPFAEAKLFGGDKIISYQLVGGKGMSEKSYLVYDITRKNVICQF
jgi:hypothetical protein